MAVTSNMVSSFFYSGFAVSISMTVALHCFRLHWYGHSKHNDLSRHSSSVPVIVLVAKPCFFVALVELGERPILRAMERWSTLSGKSGSENHCLSLSAIAGHWQRILCSTRTSDGFGKIRPYHWRSLSFSNQYIILTYLDRLTIFDPISSSQTFNHISGQ